MFTVVLVNVIVAIGETITGIIGRASMIVEDNKFRVMAEVTQQVAGKLVGKSVRHDNASHVNGLDVDSQYLRGLRAWRYARRDNRGNGNATHVHTAFVV